MSSSDDYIIIEGAKNTSDDTLDDDNTPVHNEAEQASLVALENQGVFVAQEEATTDSTAELRLFQTTKKVSLLNISNNRLFHTKLAFRHSWPRGKQERVRAPYLHPLWHYSAFST
jgi:hypothetical protein